MAPAEYCLLSGKFAKFCRHVGTARSPLREYNLTNRLVFGIVFEPPTVIRSISAKIRFKVGEIGRILCDTGDQKELNAFMYLYLSCSLCNQSMCNDQWCCRTSHLGHSTTIYLLGCTLQGFQRNWENLGHTGSRVAMVLSRYK